MIDRNLRRIVLLGIISFDFTLFKSGTPFEIEFVLQFVKNLDKPHFETTKRTKADIELLTRQVFNNLGMYRISNVYVISVKSNSKKRLHFKSNKRVFAYGVRQERACGDISKPLRIFE